MPWSIDGPSSEQLGYVQHRQTRDEEDVPAPQVRAQKPRRRRLAIGVAIALAGLIAFYGLAWWSSADRSGLAGESAGTWRSTGSVLVISNRPGGLSLSGSIEGRRVQGTIAVPAFPSLSRALHLTMLGQRWTLGARIWPHTLTLTSASGRVLTFRGSM